jgi:hypothetical protein
MDVVASFHVGVTTTNSLVGGIATAALQVMARLNEILNQELERRSHLV